MNDKLKSPQFDTLYKAILSIENLDDCYNFFDDLCTIAELKAMAQRFEVAAMLKAGHVYNEIAQQTGASSATISRVNRAFMYGSDGYKKALEKIK